MTDPTDPTEPVSTEPAPAPARDESFGDRAKAMGDELGARGQQLGREAQAAGRRWGRDAGVVRAADTASRVWGVVVLLVGLYFFAQVTLGYALPPIPWGTAWPVLLIVLGLVVLTRGMARRHT